MNQKQKDFLQDLAAFLLFISLVPALYLAGLIISGV